MTQRDASLDDALWQRLHFEAGEPYRRAGRIAYHFARGKLRHDPVFRALLARGDIAAGTRVLDLGCGQGLLAALLHAVDGIHRAGHWTACAPPPLNCSYHGIDLMPAVAQRAHDALSTLSTRPRFECADISKVALPTSDLVLLLDVLHYVELPAQQVLLRRVRQALTPQGRLLVRVGDAAQQRHAFSRWIDRAVVRLRGYRAPPHFGRPLSSWVELLQSLGFEVEAAPMSQGTPFTNVLLVARVPTRVTLPIEDALA
jgi:SAM-dependent methyltransferase